MRPIADLHTHTTGSGHAFSTLDELARAAADADVKVLGITDHGPSMTGAPAHGYFEMSHRIPRFLHGVRVLFGCEANILDHTGRIDLEPDWIPRQPLVVAGIHARSPYPLGSSLADNTAALVGAIGNPGIHIISHPFRTGFPIEPDAVAAAAAEHRTLLEVNISMFRAIAADSASAESHPAVIATRRLLQRLDHEKGAFVVGSDAHHASEVSVDDNTLKAVTGLLDYPLTSAANFDLADLAEFIPALEGLATVPHQDAWPA